MAAELGARIGLKTLSEVPDDGVLELLAAPRVLGDSTSRCRRTCSSIAIRPRVAHQAKVGIDIVNDGEFGKSGWANYILNV